MFSSLFISILNSKFQFLHGRDSTVHLRTDPAKLLGGRRKRIGPAHETRDSEVPLRARVDERRATCQLFFGPVPQLLSGDLSRKRSHFLDGEFQNFRIIKKGRKKKGKEKKY